MADTAVKPTGEIFSNPPRWIPEQFTLDHIRHLFGDFPFLSWIFRSILVATFATAGSIVLSTLAAFSFARLEWKGRDALFIVMLFFMLLPWQINVIPLFFTMRSFGFLNTIQGAALPIIASPIGIFLLRQFFINIPKELEDAARIDGCSNFRIMMQIIIPISKPVYGAYAVFMFNYAWNEFFWAAICLQKRDALTLPVGLRHLQGALDVDFGLFMAGAFIASLPVLAMFLLIRKKMIRGFTMASGGIKG
jgi:ABC-type glycerol-3-phosphate transport system permease component